jgi:plastocyanin
MLVVTHVAAIVASLALLALPLIAYAATSTVSVKDFSFQPKTITVRAGDTITWTNNDTTTHTATSTGNWDTGGFAPGTSRSITFATAGTYQYFCLLHSIMFGTVIVLPPNAASPSAAAPASTVAPPSAAATSTPVASTSEAVLAPLATGTTVVLRPPGEAGPGPVMVAGAAMAIVALATLAWLVARQT